MSDEDQPRHRSLDTDDYLAGFTAGESDLPEEPEFDESSSFPAEPPRFSRPPGDFRQAQGFPSMPTFTPVSDFPSVPTFTPVPDLSAPESSAPESESSASKFSAPEFTSVPGFPVEPDSTAEAEGSVEPEDAGEPESDYELESLAEPESAYEADSTDELAVLVEPEEPADPEPEGGLEALGEPEALVEPEALAERELAAEPEEPAEREEPAPSAYFDRPEFYDVFARPKFFGGPDFHDEPVVPAEPLVPQYNVELQEPERAAEPEEPAEPAYLPRTAEVPAESRAEPDVAPVEIAPEGEPEESVVEPMVTVEVPGAPAAQHPVRSTGELSVLREPGPPAGIASRLPDSLWGYESYPVVEGGPAPDDQGGLVSFGYIGSAIRRKKKTWLLTTALGILVAIGLYPTYHPHYTDTATVMLQDDPSLDAATALQIDTVLASSYTVAELAMQKLGVQESNSSFMKTYSVSTNQNTNNLLMFTATGSSSTAAYNEANTLATVYLQYRAQTELEKETATSTGQNQQITQQQQSIASINHQIKETQQQPSSTAQQTKLSRLQGDLTAAQNVLSSLQSNVASTEATSRSTTASLIAGSRVLDTGIPASSSKKKFLLEYGGGAVFGGLVIGLLIVSVGAIVSDKLRRRDDVAAAIGAPVRVSVASDGGKKGSELDLKRVAGYLREALPDTPDGARSLVVVAVDETRFAAEAVREMAVSAARDGQRVVVADLSGGVLAGLLGVRDPGVRGVDLEGTRIVAVLPERSDFAPLGPLASRPSLGSAPQGLASVHDAADVFVTFATVNPAVGATHLKTWGSDVVATVTAGRSSVTTVQAAGDMIRFGGAHLISAILLGTDADDQTIGYVTV